MQEQQTFTFASYAVSPLFGDPSVIMKINIRLQSQNMKRSYLKLADVVAQIAGLLKILIIIGALLSNPVKKLQYFKAVIYEIYQFQSSNSGVILINTKKLINIKRLSQPRIKQLKNSFFKKKLKKDNNKRRRSNSENGLDIYGQRIQLSFHKKNSYNTVFGGLISFVVLCSFLVGCWFYTKLGILMSDHIIDPLNFQNPVSNRAISLYSVASSQFPQETDLSLTNYYIETDRGVFYTELQDDEAIKEETILRQSSNINIIDNSKDKICQKSQNKINKQIKKETNSEYLRLKDENQIAKDAYEGLNNILNKKKLSKVDENLIRIIDPELLQQIKQSNTQKENDLTQVKYKENMKRYSSVQPSRTNNYLQNQNQEEQSNQSYNIDDMEVVITKIKRQEIKIKEPWCKAPSQKLNCGKSHNDSPEYTHVSAQKWLENRIKKRNQERALLKALHLQKEQEEQFKDCIYQDQLNNDINTKQANQQNKRLINNSSSQLRQDKVLWKKRMINELHDINRFMDQYNQKKRQERAFLKRQKIIGDIDFDDKDQKKLEHNKEQRERLNQLHKRLYGHESLERVLAKGLIKELLQDFIHCQISIGIQEKDEITETLTVNSKQINAIKQRHNSIEQKFLNDQKPVFANRNEDQAELVQKKAKSKSYHSTYFASNSPDKKIQSSKRNQQKTDAADNKNTLDIDGDGKEQDNKNNYKTRSDVHFHNIDKINKQINYQMIKNDNQQYIYTFAEDQAIREKQSDQIIQQNKQRQSLIEEQLSSQYFKKNEQEAANKQKYSSCNARSFQASDHLSSSQFNCSQDDIFMSILNKSLVYLDKHEKSMKNLKQNFQSLKKEQSIVIQDSDLQQKETAARESLNILGDEELGKDYFKYLRKNNDQQQQKQQEEIKLKLKDNPSFTKILAMKKIENISKLQNFYDDYINHIQTKILNNNDKVQKVYMQKPDYKSLSVLPTMQKKAEKEEEEKLRNLREEEEKNRAKKTRVFKKFQSQNDLSEVTTTMNAKKIKIKEQGDKQTQTSKQINQKNNEQNGDGGFSQIYDKILSMNLKKKQNLQENDNYHENTIRFQILNSTINGNTQRGQTPSKQFKQQSIYTTNREQPDQQQQNHEQQNTEQSKATLRQIRDNSPLTSNLKFKDQNNNELNSLNEQQKFVLQLYNNQGGNKLNNLTQNQNETKTSRQLQNNSNLIKQNTSELQNSNQKIEVSEFQTSETIKNNNKLKINTQQYECYKPINQQEMNSPLVKRVKEEKNQNNFKKIDQNQYYTPQKVIKDIENPQRDQISMSNRNTTAESPDIKLKYKQSQYVRSAVGHRKSDSVGRIRSFQNIRNVSISNLQGFEKVNQQSSISLKMNGFSNASLIEKVINLNKQCISESQNVNKINKHILLRQKRNLRTFIKLDNMVNSII
ncbi:hypothetical protein ABPG72_005424 [Tetrahymena utriculariae]